MPLIRVHPCAALMLALGALTACIPAVGAQATADWMVPRMPPAEPIAPAEFQARRAALADSIPEGALLVLGARAPAASHVSFAQTPDFRYLTGINEPGAALLITRNGRDVKQTLFVLPANPAREIWEGSLLGVEGALARTGLTARPSDALESVLDSLAAAARVPLHILEPAPAGEDLLDDLSAAQQTVSRLMARHPGLVVRSLGSAIQRLRAVKSEAELDRIRRAVHITTLAHREAMRAIRPGMNEFEIQGLIEYTFRRYGAERPGFATIVGSGPNSTTLHYTANDRFFGPHDLVVMDIGAAFDGYTADVTRTVPVAGTFSPEQRAIYEIVLAAQMAAEATARPGATWRELSSAADDVIAAGLTRLGLIDAPDATFQAGSGTAPQLRLFYMHGLGHGIGLQVHDPEASYFGTFQPGSAFTIEPGIYVRSDVLDHLPDTPQNRAMIQRLRPAVARYADIGVRIEDDYLITAAGVDRISTAAPREIAAIEQLMREEPPGADERQGEVVDWYRPLSPR